MSPPGGLGATGPAAVAPTGPAGAPVGATGPLEAPSGIRPRRTIPPSPRSQSGEHPAVTHYRDKLESIVEGTEKQGASLDKKLQEYLEEIRTPPPPPSSR